MESDFHNLHNLDNIVGYCNYCKGSIYVGDTYVSNKHGLYHPECYEQMNTYFDTLEVDE